MCLCCTIRRSNRTLSILLLLVVLLFHIPKGHGGTLLVTVDCVRGSLLFSREKLLRALFGAETIEVRAKLWGCRELVCAPSVLKDYYCTSQCHSFSVMHGHQNVLERTGFSKIFLLAFELDCRDSFLTDDVVLMGFIIILYDEMMYH